MSETNDLPALFRAVTAARDAVEEARRRPASGAPSAARKQEELWWALERCAVEVGRRGQPFPYRLRNEVTMYRLMFGTRGPRRR